MASSLEDAHMHTNPTADEIMDTTEIKDGSSEDNLSQVNGDIHSVEDEDDAGLFGSGSDDEDSRHVHLFVLPHSIYATNSDRPVNGKQRQLDDKELDSGDDEGRKDRVEDDMEGMDDEEQEQQQVTISDMSLCPHATPRGSDKEVGLEVHSSLIQANNISLSVHSSIFSRILRQLAFRRGCLCPKTGKPQSPITTANRHRLHSSRLRRRQKLPFAGDIRRVNEGDCSRIHASSAGPMDRSPCKWLQILWSNMNCLQSH